MAVLCDFQDRPPRGVIHEILTRLVDRLHEAPPRLREYVEMFRWFPTSTLGTRSWKLCFLMEFTLT